MTYYFVTYEITSDKRSPVKGNVILRNIHPVEWIAARGRIESYAWTLLFWEEIPEKIAEGVEGVSGIAIEES